jgi:hypothetical protein
MQVDINIKDAITPALERTRTALLDTKPILDDVAFAIETLLARHLRQTHATKPNRLGAPSTGFCPVPDLCSPHASPVHPQYQTFVKPLQTRRRITLCLTLT